MDQKDTLIINQTDTWIRSFIIKLNICPFAKGAVNKGSLRIAVSSNTKVAQALEDLMAEIHLLDNEPGIETSLLVFSNAFKEFFNYLDFVAMAEQLIQLQGYEGVYQLATFHPDYFFADADPDEAANYTNRSPYPMLHLLREEQLEKAIKAYGDTSKIPEKNIALLNELGLDKIKLMTELL